MILGSDATCSAEQSAKHSTKAAPAGRERVREQRKTDKMRQLGHLALHYSPNRAGSVVTPTNRVGIMHTAGSTGGHAGQDDAGSRHRAAELRHLLRCKCSVSIYRCRTARYSQDDSDLVARGAASARLLGTSGPRPCSVLAPPR